MRYSTLRYIQALIVSVSLVALLGIGLKGAELAGYNFPSLSLQSVLPLSLGSPREQIALISGHASYDSGAICTDENGNVTITEAEVNAAIADTTARHLRDHRLDVMVLNEYDERLNGLDVALLLSLHSDSCIDHSGYKAARHPNSQVAAQADAFLACLDEHYSLRTGLAYHPNTLTHDMFEYHAFGRVEPMTPAVILEMGFLGGDQKLLLNEQSVIARGISDSILCFLDKQRESESQKRAQ